MGKKLFGTDGIRGTAGKPPLDPRTVTALGIALAEDLKSRGEARHPVLIGMDTRESGPSIAAHLAEGLRRGGADAAFAGVLTTPGVAYLTRTGDYSAGVMISASHNPFGDNGIKVFARTGFKLPDAEEHQVEEAIFRLLDGIEEEPKAEALRQNREPKTYLDFLLSTLTSARPLAGMKVAMDCGNGAASALAPELFRAAGAEVTPIACEPDGRNINLKCGALHPENVRAKVLETGADAGVSFDGDADRAMLVAPSGRIVDGDAVMLIEAKRLQAAGHLPGNTVVATVMSNLGLQKGLEELGISMVRTPVGDKYVLEEMVRREAALGGEQSGHVIFREFSTTGDGMLTALQVLETAAKARQSLDELAAGMVVYPQMLVNVRVKERRPLEELSRVSAAIKDCEARLDGSGRVLVRYSGTEPLLRVMVEAMELGVVEELVNCVTAAIHADLG
ncbi:MAG TPA: phosphoglucosamine mutase [Bryobacteraceae bacterium]|nr:phosphoglucosamine mutase [Bryobacteraceae bacterium]